MLYFINCNRRSEYWKVTCRSMMKDCGLRVCLCSQEKTGCTTLGKPGMRSCRWFHMAQLTVFERYLLADVCVGTLCSPSLSLQIYSSFRPGWTGLTVSEKLWAEDLGTRLFSSNINHLTWCNCRVNFNFTKRQYLPSSWYPYVYVSSINWEVTSKKLSLSFRDTKTTCTKVIRRSSSISWISFKKQDMIITITPK